MSDTAGIDGLDVIESAEREVIFAGERIKVKPLTIGQLPKFARAIKGLGGALTFDPKALSPALLLDLIADHGDPIIDACVVASGLDRARIEAAGPQDLVALIAVILSVNSDFFARSLNPLLVQVRASLASGAGQTASPA